MWHRVEKLRNVNGPSVISLAYSRILFAIRCARKLFLCVAHLVRFSRVRPEDSHCITIPSSTRASRTLQIYVARNDCRQWSIITETVHDKRICNDFRFDLICYAPFCARRFYRWIALGARFTVVCEIAEWSTISIGTRSTIVDHPARLERKRERERERDREFIEM